MVRNIFMSESLEDKLNNLVDYKQEVNGVIFYKRQGKALILSEDTYLTGVGTVGGVGVDRDRWKVVLNFLKLNPDYGYIKFHTHTKTTINRFGSQFAYNFSRQDMEALDYALSIDDAFISMLVTPERILVKGIGYLNLVIFETLGGGENNMPENVKSKRIYAQRVTERELGRRISDTLDITYIKKN